MLFPSFMVISRICHLFSASSSSRGSSFNLLYLFLIVMLYCGFITLGLNDCSCPFVYIFLSLFSFTWPPLGHGRRCSRPLGISLFAKPSFYTFYL